MQVKVKVKKDKVEQTIADQDKKDERKLRVVPTMPSLMNLFDAEHNEMFDEVTSLREVSEQPTLESQGSFELDDEIG